jgi:hypothetical protein
MLNAPPVTEGLVFASFLYNVNFSSEETLRNKWEASYGPSFYLSHHLNPLAKYYSAEMGQEILLKRFFALSAKAFSRETLLASKLTALEWEKAFSIESKRMVNVDIGMLSLENFILATTKNYSHRVYVGSKIFADLTYQFHLGKFQILPWTYPDYHDDEKMEFFTWGRAHLHNLLTHGKG